jgi:hypothetical protein
VRLEREMETRGREILAGTDAHRVESVHAFTLGNVRFVLGGVDGKVVMTESGCSVARLHTFNGSRFFTSEIATCDQDGAVLAAPPSPPPPLPQPNIIAQIFILCISASLPVCAGHSC